MSSGALVEAALDIARGLVASAEPSGEGLMWHADIVVGIEGDAPVIGHGDVGETLYDGTAGIAVGLAACATSAPAAETAPLAEACLGAARHALSGADVLLEAGRLGLYDGATGVAWSAATAGRAVGDQALLDRAAGLAQAVTTRLEAIPEGAELDLIGGLAGTLLGLQAVASVLGVDAPSTALRAGAQRLAAAAVPQAWGSAWATGGANPGGPPLLGLGHGAAGIALALAEMAGPGEDAAAVQASAQGLEYERAWFDPNRVAWPDLRAVDAAGEATGSMTAWCHGAIGIGLSRLRLAQLTGSPAALAEASAALQAARNLVVDIGTALRGGRTSDCTPCHGLAGVVELMLVAAQALEVPDHARAARRVAGLMLEQRDAAAGAWPCGLAGAGEIPGLMVGTTGIALTLLRAAGASDLPTPLLPGTSGW